MNERRYQSAMRSPQNAATTAPAAMYGPNGIIALRSRPIASATMPPDAPEQHGPCGRDPDEAQAERSEHDADDQGELHVTHAHATRDDRHDEQHARVEERADERTDRVGAPVEQPTPPPRRRRKR